MDLDFDDRGFPEQARKLICAGQPLSFEVRGVAFELLQPYLIDGHIADETRLGIVPELRPLLGVLLLAGGLERHVSSELLEGSFRVRVAASAQL